MLLRKIREGLKDIENGTFFSFKHEGKEKPNERRKDWLSGLVMESKTNLLVDYIS